MPSVRKLTGRACTECGKPITVQITYITDFDGVQTEVDRREHCSSGCPGAN